jgi:heme exporter protein A
VIIEVRKLVKRFGAKPVLRGLDFSVNEGEFVALVGPNGAGKTTFLRVLASLARPTLGNVSIAGFQLPSQASSVRRNLGVVSHLPLLYGDLTAQENLQFYGKMYCVPELHQRIKDVLDLVGLATRRNDLVRTFSRGMQQRLAIGRACMIRLCCSLMSLIPGWIRKPVTCWTRFYGMWLGAAGRSL